MPYIPPNNRPAINAPVDALAEELADALIAQRHTAEISVHYRKAFREIADFIATLERQPGAKPAGKAQELGRAIVETARGYNLKGAWAGELNYALTQLIQMVPFKMLKKKVWEESLRYWLYAQTVGALTRAGYEIHARYGDDYIGNGLAGVFEDVKDEYKRRVNTAYEAAQIRKSGDCYDHVPYRTQLVPFKVADAEGFIEVMLPYRQL
jgi:hypothetical protein